ncbi:MAG: polysaccharide pyruvyl transferase family protein [Planctomycetota bacterium]
MTTLLNAAPPAEPLPSVGRSAFLSTALGWAGRKVFFEPLEGNHGDRLIRLGARRVMEQAGCLVVDSPGDAEQIFINGGGAMNDIWKAGFGVLERYRRDFPNTPITVGPSTYLVRDTDFPTLCAAGRAPLHFFARDERSADILRAQPVDAAISVTVSQDLAFELRGSALVEELEADSADEHVLVCLRKDKEGSAGLLTHTKGTWLPRVVRRPLSRLRDRLVAAGQRDQVSELIRSAGVPADVPRLVRDVSVSVGWEDFTHAISRARLVITDRLHVAILGYLLDKPVFLGQGCYHKTRGVYELSMTHPASRVRMIDEGTTS